VTFFQALVLALLQGVSELFPISSLGHTILVPALLHWNNIDRSSASFLAFVVVLHLGTALALIVFYRTQWYAIVRALARSIAVGRLSSDRDERTGWLLVVATIPVGLLGLVLEHPVRRLFGSPSPAALFLLINGLIMFAGEALRRAQERVGARKSKPIDRLSYPESLFNLDHEHAARFSFLLATPVILAAALLEFPRLFAPQAHLVLVQAIAGGIAAGVAAYLSVAFLTRYFRSNDLRPFGWYCIVVGSICFVLARKGVIT
jgi:undecaprenyl-diphosphatase